jgi:hypothetical protein
VKILQLAALTCLVWTSAGHAGELSYSPANGLLIHTCRDDSATIVALMSRLESITAQIVAAPIISSTIVRAGRSAVAISASATAIGTGSCGAAPEGGLVALSLSTICKSR